MRQRRQRLVSRLLPACGILNDGADALVRPIQPDVRRGISRACQLWSWSLSPYDPPQVSHQSNATWETAMKGQSKRVRKTPKELRTIIEKFLSLEEVELATLAELDLLALIRCEAVVERLQSIVAGASAALDAKQSAITAEPLRKKRLRGDDDIAPAKALSRAASVAPSASAGAPLARPVGGVAGEMYDRLLQIIQSAPLMNFEALAAAREHYRAQLDERLEGLRDHVAAADLQTLAAGAGMAGRDVAVDDLLLRVLDAGHAIEDGQLVQKPLVPWNASASFVKIVPKWASELASLHVAQYPALDALFGYFAVEFDGRVQVLVETPLNAVKVTDTTRNRVARWLPGLSDRLKDKTAVVALSVDEAKTLAGQAYTSSSGSLSLMSYALPGDKARPAHVDKLARKAA